MTPTGVDLAEMRRALKMVQTGEETGRGSKRVKTQYVCASVPHDDHFIMHHKHMLIFYMI